MNKSMVAVATAALAVVSMPAFAASQRCEIPAEVEFTRVRGEGRRVEYAVSIRHYAPTELANVGWDYVIRYRGTDDRQHFVHSRTSHSTARRRDSQSSYTSAQPPSPPIAEITDYEIRNITCYY